MKDNSSKRHLGYIGEDIASRYLEDSGYVIIARNYTIRGGEIDIIAADGETIVFVEVKTRRTRENGRASEAVDGKKIERLCLAAERFLYEKKDDPVISGKKVRFDVFEVYTQNRLFRHIKNIDIN